MSEKSQEAPAWAQGNPPSSSNHPNRTGLLTQSQANKRGLLMPGQQEQKDSMTAQARGEAAQKEAIAEQLRMEIKKASQPRESNCPKCGYANTVKPRTPRTTVGVSSGSSPSPRMSAGTTFVPTSAFTGQPGSGESFFSAPPATNPAGNVWATPGDEMFSRAKIHNERMGAIIAQLQAKLAEVQTPVDVKCKNCRFGYVA